MANMPIQNLFTALQNTPGRAVATKGDIVFFNYIGENSIDPAPIVIITDIFSDSIRGINFHHIIGDMTQLVKNYAGNPNFSYKLIKDNTIYVDAFRTYKRTGISQLRLLNIKFIKSMLEKLQPGEIEQMRAQVRQQTAEASQQPIAEPSQEQVI